MRIMPVHKSRWSGCAPALCDHVSHEVALRSPVTTLCRTVLDVTPRLPYRLPWHRLQAFSLTRLTYSLSPCRSLTTLCTSRATPRRWPPTSGPSPPRTPSSALPPSTSSPTHTTWSAACTWCGDEVLPCVAGNPHTACKSAFVSTVMSGPAVHSMHITPPGVRRVPSTAVGRCKCAAATVIHSSILFLTCAGFGEE